MTNKEIIKKLKGDGIIYVWDDVWYVEFAGGAEPIGSIGFTVKDICDRYREQVGL